MKLKAKINYTDFLMEARKCGGDVFFCTAEGDRLNLKSLLCEYIFIAAALQTNLLENGEVVCADPADAAKLADYVEAEA